jgi:hypothetical protein
MRLNLTPVRMDNIKQTKKNTSHNVEKKRNPIHCWWEYKLVPPLWKLVWRYLRKLK